MPDQVSQPGPEVGPGAEGRQSLRVPPSDSDGRVYGNGTRPSTSLVTVEERNEIVLQNIRLAYKVARRRCFQNRGIEQDDLDQLAVLGLMRAAELFDPALGYAFSTYAYHWCRQAIQRGIANGGALVRIPQYLDVELGQRSRGTLEGPDTDCQRHGKLARKANAIGGFEHVIEEKVSSTGPSAEEVAELNDQAALMRRHVAQLPMRLRTLVILAYGLNGPALDHGQLADRFGISRARIGQLLTRARRLLARSLAA